MGETTIDPDSRDLLNSVLDWVHGACPCGNAGPAQCPVCGARIDDPTGFCAMGHRRRFPSHLLGRVEQALGIAPALIAQAEQGASRHG